MIIYYFTYFFTKLLSLIFFPRTVVGWENIPQEGGYLLACNHVSNLDPVIMGISTKRRLHFMAKIELFKHPVLGWWLRKLWAFPVKRGEADFGALKEALKWLKKGDPVLVFPEGTRRMDQKPIAPQAGTGFLAIKSNVAVLPVYIEGSERIMPPKSKFFKRGPVLVAYGKPFFVSDSLSYEAASKKILEEIYKLA